MLVISKSSKLRSLLTGFYSKIQDATEISILYGEELEVTQVRDEDAL